MNRLLPPLALPFLLALGTAQAAPEPGRATETRNVAAFSAIDVSGAQEATIAGAGGDTYDRRRRGRQVKLVSG